MSPIKNLSETVRMPRLGKIRLGYRDPTRNNAPVRADYFVIPKDHSDYQKIVDAFGEKPKELRVLIPVEDEEQWATQYYKAYNMTRGLVCKGDGDNAVRMVDAKTGNLPDKATETVKMVDMPCAGKDCPEYKAKKCGETMNLKFMLPEIPGIGVWQIDTGSINSILNINSCAKLIKKAFGRITLIPLTLSLESAQVNNPTDGKKQTVYVMNLRTNVTLNQLANNAREQAKTLQLEQPDMEAEYDQQLKEDADAAWGDMGSANPKNKEPTTVIEGTAKVVEPAVEVKSTEQQKPPRDPASIKSLGDLYNSAKVDWPDKFKLKSDILKFIDKREADIADPAAEYEFITNKMK